MCTLVVCRPRSSPFPLLLAENREEDAARSTAPPGLHLVEGTRAVCPRDRRHGGSWIGLNEHGLVAALTNWTAGSRDPEARSRGACLLALLSAASLDEALQSIRSHCALGPVRSFQAVVGDAERLFYLRHGARQDLALEVREIEDDVLVISDRHEPGQLVVAGLESWTTELATSPCAIEEQLDHLVVLLATGKTLETETGVSAAICRDAGARRSVSSTLLALPRDGRSWRLRYGPGSPRAVVPRDYSWLGARLRN